MTREDTKQLIRFICATYPNFKPQSISDTIDAWQAILGSFDKESINAAVKAYILTSDSDFAPGPSAIIKEIHKYAEPEYLNESQAWSMVKRAIENSSYGAIAEFNKLPKEVQRAVGGADQLQRMARDEHFNEGVESSNFKRAYKTAVENEKELKKVPEEIRLQLAKVANRLSIERLEA